MNLSNPLTQNSSHHFNLSRLIGSISLFLAFFFSIFSVKAAYLENIPMTLLQPNGDTLYCYVSGDEFFNYLHDKEGYTIIQNQEGYYMYAMYDGDRIVPSQFIAGIVNPSKVGLQPNVIISPEEYSERRAQYFYYQDIPRPKTADRNRGVLNNLVVFIRFADDSEITKSFSGVERMFNSQEDGFNSMYNYFRATSYGQLTISSFFFPEPEENKIVSYQDIYPRGYYRPFDTISINPNPEGYQGGDNGLERREREHQLLKRAIEHIAEMVPSDLDLDYNNDGYVDNVCFVVKGGVGAWAALLWPHRWSLFSEEVYIHGKRVWDYNFMLENSVGYFNTAVLSHEMQHSLSYPDLYHYNNLTPTPVGNWDIMESNPYPPQQSGGYMKWKYGNWLNEPTTIQPGKYTLNSIGSGLGFVSYKIPSSDSRQFFVLEFRNASDLFDNCYGANATGLLIYRINTNWNGNAGYNPAGGVFDEVYIFRPSGNSPTANGTISRAHFGVDDRITFDATTNPKPFLTNGTFIDNLSITEIEVIGNKVSFTYNYGTTQYVSVVYQANGTKGTMLPQMLVADVPHKLLQNTFSLDGRIFKGWALTPDGEVEYSDNQIITISEDIVLYPVFYPLGVTELEKNSSSFHLYPNPASNYLEIVLSDSPFDIYGVGAHFYDAKGLLIKSMRLNSVKTQIDISNLSKGFYIVKVGNEAKKLIIK